jgi:hypothetical protein
MGACALLKGNTMHKTDVNTRDSKTQTRAAKKPREFEPHIWLHGVKPTREANLLALAKDVAGGTKLVLQMIERAQIDTTDAEPSAYIGPYECGVLTRFAITSCALLHDRIEDLFDGLRAEAGK